MIRTSQILDDDLQDYLDGRLTEDRLTQVEDHLRAHPSKAADADALARQGAMLRNLGREVLEEPIPERLSAMLKTPSQQAETRAAPGAPISRGLWSRVPEALAACLLLMIGAAAGWGANEYAQPKPPSELDLILPETAFAFSFFSSGDSYNSFYTPDRFADFETATKDIFSRSIPRPDLTDVGYNYAGARIVPALSRNVGYLFYQSPEGDRISVVFWRSSTKPDRMPVSRSLGDLAARAWSEEGFGFAVLGQEREGVLDQVTKSAVSYFETAFESQ